MFPSIPNTTFYVKKVVVTSDFDTKMRKQSESTQINPQSSSFYFLFMLENLMAIVLIIIN